MSELTSTEYHQRMVESLLDAATRIQGASDESEAARIVAEGVASTGWATVIVSLYDDAFETVALETVGVDDEMHRRILAKRGDAPSRRAIFDPSRDRFLIGRFYFIPEEAIDGLGLSDIVIPTGQEPSGEWKPRDHAYAPLRDIAGAIIGRVAIDAPVCRKRPNAESLKTLSSFIDLASRTIENLRLRDELKNANTLVEHSAMRWKRLVESLNVVAWEGRPDSFDFTYVSPHAERLLGYSVLEWLGPGFWVSRLHPDDRERAVEYCMSQTKLGQGHDFEYRMIARDGRVVWVRDSVSLITGASGTTTQICGLLIDITENKLAEQARLEQANRLRLLIEQLPAIMWTVDRDLVFTSSEGRGLEALGSTPGKAVGQSLMAYFGTEDRDFPPIASHIRALGGSLENYEFEWRDCTFEVHVEPLYGPDGEIAGAIGVALDISRRKKAEIQSTRDREELRKTTDAIPVLIAHLDRDCNYLFNNATYERWFLKPRDQITGHHASQLSTPESYARVKPYIERALRGETVQFEIGVHGRVNGVTHIRSTFSPDLDDEGRVQGFYSVTMDISDRIQAEQALSVALERQSNLLRELNHRVKNSMAGLLSLIDLCRNRERSVGSFADAISHRVMGMTRVHALLSSSDWQAIDLRSLLAALHPPRAPGSFSAEGPPVVVPPGAATAMGMLLQELFSNSLMHGALDHQAGRVTVSWSILPDAVAGITTVELVWHEVGGPPIDGVPTLGLGTELISGFARHDLRGSIEFRFPREGVHHRLIARFENAHPNA